MSIRLSLSHAGILALTALGGTTPLAAPDRNAVSALIIVLPILILVVN